MGEVSAGEEGVFRNGRFGSTPPHVEKFGGWVCTFGMDGEVPRKNLPSRMAGGTPSPWGGPCVIMPAVDLFETGDHIMVRADVPGIDAKRLDISISGNLLTIRGERKEEYRGESGSFHWLARPYGSLGRSFTLPADVKEDGIEALDKGGVFIASIPKAESFA